MIRVLSLLIFICAFATLEAQELDGTTEDFQAGKKFFSEIGCASCHRPTWTTGEDNI